MPKVAPHSFNILLTPKTFATLTRLAKDQGCTRAHFVRQLIRHVFMMEEHKQPICADGGRCVAAHLHPITQKGNPTNAS